MSRFRIYLIFILTFLISSSTSGQNIGSCGEVLPSLQQRTIQKEQFLKWNSQQKVNSSLKEVTIPIVFHLLNNSKPSVSSLQKVIDEVNRAFANEGEYRTDYGKDSKIRFCRARASPDGGATDGMNLIQTRYEDFDMDLETSDLLNHVYWDQSRYINVWVANAIRGENFDATYYTGKSWWNRAGVGGFAAGRGVVMTGLSAPTLIHEIGHYLGLLHPFQGYRSDPCKNDDCLIDGDMICDTPPDRSIINSCGMNSCDTDTLSNYSNHTFFKDTVDMGSNFMDYDGCPIDFSHGQIDRMHFIIESRYPDLSIENNLTNLCEKPCDIEAVGVMVDQELVIAGQQVNFTTTPMTYDHYEWYVFPEEGSWEEHPAPSNLVCTSGSLDYTFHSEGWVTVYVKAWNNSDASCYTSFSRNVMVTCGVDARFSPDKRRLASKQPHALFTDSLTLVNYSVGANSYEWIVKFTGRNGETPFPNFTSSDEDFTFPLQEPGEYEVQLSASDGSCTDQSNSFFFSVADPTIDGSPVIESISCGGESSTLVEVTLFNYGFDTINAGTPISFYNGDPFEATGAELLGSYQLPESVLGLNELVGYESKTFAFNVDVDFETLTNLFVVFNDEGTTTFPIQFPPEDEDVLSSNSQFPSSGYAELTYSNNYASQEVRTLKPPEDIVACIGEELTFSYGACENTITWISDIQGILGKGAEIDYLVEGNDRITISINISDDEIQTHNFQVIVNVPELTIPVDTYTITKGETIQLLASFNSINEIAWSPASSLSNAFIASPLASPEETTTYTVNITDSLGCTATGEITVNVVSSGYIPNLFTPNNDGRNDQLLIYDLDGVETFSFKIFNRMGNTVFFSSDVEKMKVSGWDGNWKGVKQPSGVFYWVVSGRYSNGKELKLNNKEKGIIHLVR